MDIVIAGAHGKIARRLARLLVATSLAVIFSPKRKGPLKGPLIR